MENSGADIKVIIMLSDGVGEDDCYRMLREMYPAVLSCTDLTKLTGQLLLLVSRELE